MCGRRPCVKCWGWHGDDCGRVQSHVSGLFVQPFSRLLALMWFARWVLITYVGSTPVTERRFSCLDDRPINIMPSAPPQRDALRRVPLALALQSCAAAAAFTLLPSPLYPMTAHTWAR
jgi:hypothetical protein